MDEVEEEAEAMVKIENTIINCITHQYQHLPAPLSQGQGNLPHPLVSSITVGPSKTYYYGQYGSASQHKFYMASDGKFYPK